jgi:mRNA interferase YafQ
MRTIDRTSQFKKDVKRTKKRGKNLDKLKKVIEKLVEGKELESRYHDHILQGKYSSVRECHIEPDWLLLYQLSKTSLILIRTGTHTDLFE